MLKWKTEKEAKISENDKPRVVLKKEPWAETKTEVTTTVRRKPNKNQHEKERRKRQA